MNQSSDAGALFDAVADKYKKLRVGTAAWQQDAIPKWFLVSEGITESTHLSLTAITKYRHKNTTQRPPKSAKRSMFLRNVAGGAFLFSNAYEQEQPELERHQQFRQLGNQAAIASIPFEIPTLKTYARRAFGDSLRAEDYAERGFDE